MSVGIQNFSWSGIYEPQVVLASSSSTPSITFNFVTMPNPSDVIKIYDGASLLGSYTVTQTDINNGSFTLGMSALSSGAHSLRFIQVRGTKQSAYSNTLTLTV